MSQGGCASAAAHAQDALASQNGALLLYVWMTAIVDERAMFALANGGGCHMASISSSA